MVCLSNDGAELLNVTWETPAWVQWAVKNERANVPLAVGSRVARNRSPDPTGQKNSLAITLPCAAGGGLKAV